MNRLLTWISHNIPLTGPLRSFGSSIVRIVYPSYFRKSNFKDRTLDDIFTDHYQENYWGSSESVSGYGSTLKYTANLRSELPALFERLSVKTILDAPCGDYNWFRHVERNADISYIGADIVAPLIQANNEKYASENTRFMVVDITRDPLPAADLWICRDALFHLSFRDIALAMQNLLKSEIKYILFTSHFSHEKNGDILSGDFRPLNLEIAPFNFPEPIFAIDDWIRGFTERRMSLWETAEIAKILTNSASSILDAQGTENKPA